MAATGDFFCFALVLRAARLGASFSSTTATVALLFLVLVFFSSFFFACRLFVFPSSLLDDLRLRVRVLSSDGAYASVAAADDDVPVPAA